MSYKDQNKNREYQREQMRRRRAKEKEAAIKEREASIPLGDGIVGSILVSRINRTENIIFRTDHIGMLDRYAKRHGVSLSAAVGAYIQKGLAHDAILEMEEKRSGNMKCSRCKKDVNKD